MLTSEKFAQVAYDLTTKGITYAEMDCHEFVEHCLRQIGIRANWKGSNHMFRDMSWIGTPEECMEQYGCIPEGALLYIWDNDGGELARGYTDGLGNASHVGVYTARGQGAAHSSASRGGVYESKFAGKTIRNGGWNRVGLCKHLDYAVTGQKAEETDVPSANVCPTCGQEIAMVYTRLLKRGVKGDDVAAVQQKLMDLGYDLGGYGADGDYGVYTFSAVRQFQKTKCLDADGIVGPETWACLMN